MREGDGNVQNAVAVSLVEHSVPVPVSLRSS